MRKSFAIGVLNAVGGLCWILAQHPQISRKTYHSLLIKNVTIHTGNGNTIQNGIVIVVDSVISFVGTPQDTSINEKSFEKVIDGEGGHLYPGLIALNSRLGLIEIDALRPTRDVSEVEDMAPEVLAYTAYNVDSRLIPTALTNGILIVESTPYGGSISGRSSIMRTAGWTKQEAAIKKIGGLHVRWESLPIDISSLPEDKQKEVRKKYHQRIQKMSELFLRAKAFARGTDASIGEDPRLQAIVQVYSDSIPLFIHCRSAEAIKESILFFRRMEVPNIVVVGGSEIHRCLDFIKKQGVRVVLTKIHSLPAREEDPIDIVFRLPVLLYKNGIEFCIGGGEGWGDAWDIRNLPFYAGTAVGYGLPYEEAVRSITLSCARISGIDSKYGSIEPGKSATFLISRGDLLNPPTSVLTYAFIDGHEIKIDDYHRYLFRRWMERYIPDAGNR